MKRHHRLLAAFLALVLAGAPVVAFAARRGGAQTSVNRNTNVNRNVNVNNNVNVNRNVNVNVDVHGHAYGYGYDDYHPVARAVVVTAAVAVTAHVIGEILYTPPPSPVTVVVSGVTYIQSGSTWYAPQFNGTTTTYVVVAAPR
ncbi:MAG: hypothetical protein WDM96_08655 [Lacunisphaera sp.]